MDEFSPFLSTFLVVLFLLSTFGNYCTSALGNVFIHVSQQQMKGKITIRLRSGEG